MDEKFAKIVKNIHIEEDILELVKNSLLESHNEEKEYLDNKLNTLQRQKERLTERLHRLYIDKLDGRISEEFYDNLSWQWGKEIEEINEVIGRYERANLNYISKGLYILELAKKPILYTKSKVG